MRLPRVLEPLRHRDFRLLWAGQTVSMLGNFVYNVALPFQILALGGSPVQLGIGFGISTGVQMVTTLFGGAIVDRVPRRTVMLASDVGSGIVSGAIAVLGFAGLLRIEHLYVASAVFGFVFAFFYPASQAIIPELVPEEVLVAGNAARGISRQAARVGGPVLGGLLVTSVGPPAAFAFDAVTFFVSAAALLVMSGHPVSRGVGKHLLVEVREGIAFVFSLPWLWITIFGFALVNAGISGPMAVALPILLTTAGLGATAYGILTACVGIGEAIGGILIAQMKVRRAGIVMYLFAVLSGVAVLGFGLSSALPVLGVLAGALGLSFVGFGILWETALQRHVPRALLGRVSSVDMFGAIMLGPVSPLVTGVLVQQTGPATAFLAGGTLVTVLCLGAFLVPSIRELE